MHQVITSRYYRISKQAAKRRYDNCQKVYMIPCNLHPENIYFNMVCPEFGGDFDDIIRNFMFYNCTAETGRYVSFYVEIKDI